MTDFLLLNLTVFDIVLEFADSRELKLAGSHTLLKEDIDVTESSALVSARFQRSCGRWQKYRKLTLVSGRQKNAQMKHRAHVPAQNPASEVLQPEESDKSPGVYLQPVLAP